MARDYALLWANGMKFDKIMTLMREDILSGTEADTAEAGQDASEARPDEEEQAADAGQPEGS